MQPEVMLKGQVDSKRDTENVICREVEKCPQELRVGWLI